ncbi:ABC transporter substrate-binding protein [Methylomonas rosea]|uniref:Iron-siderophore ABC transporter substrate-binding protein n=1 Tax=Methylomonas rosea TaxID=2952227 RepID=A0ABT1TYQ6_9GAMM|nr:iron-siderophore ABC transporter substrate-binding protein [Methylomonas sp. WSC-7]MCQ8119889.1 iron-siderophore ABC transporter substrate-binding protein [Methylomonas sp. WSC-7]
MNAPMVGAVLLLALLLAACDGPPPAVPEAAARELIDAVGRPVRVPQAAQRIVALSELDLDATLALGLQPVGASNGRGSNHPPRYLGERVNGIASVGDFAQPSLDRIVALRPDLILAGGQSDPGFLDQLRAIAPTVVSFYPGEYWQDSLKRIADAVGRQQTGVRVLDDYRGLVARLRENLNAHRGESVSIVRLTPNGPMYMLGDAFAGRVLDDLGLTRPPAQRGPGAGHGPPLSREVLADIDGDWLFIGNFAPDPRGVAELRDEPAFSELRAARRHRIREVDAALWTVIGGPLAARAVLDDVAAAFAAVETGS